MTFITASVSEALTDHELFILSSFAHGLLRVLLRDIVFTKIMKSLVQCSKTLDSSYSISFQETHVSSFAKDLVSYGLEHWAVKSNYSRYVCNVRLV